MARHLLVTMTDDQIAEADRWYADAHSLCVEWSARTGYTVQQCAAVLALYSVNNH
jgi:hypothetical protein